MPTKDGQAPGLDAINQVLASFYGQNADRTFSESELTGSGSPALESISVYRSQSDSLHWHYVTFGFSELFEKESEDAELSGLGFELTFRLTVADNENSPPRWPCDLLNNLARTIFENGTHLQPGNHFEFRDPLNTDAITRITAVLIARDVELGTIETKFGRVEFLQVVGITADEVNILKRWRGDKFIDLAKTKLGNLLLTDLKRESLAADPSVALQIEESVTADGTGDIVLNCSVAEWFFSYKGTITLGIDIIPQLKARLVEGISGKRDVIVRNGSHDVLVFRYGRETSFQLEDFLIIECTVSDAHAFVHQLEATPSSYSFPNIPVGIDVIDPRNPTSPAEDSLQPKHKTDKKNR